MGKIYLGKPLKIKTRKELIATLRPHDWQFLRADNGDLPDGCTPGGNLAANQAWSNQQQPSAQLA